MWRCLERSLAPKNRRPGGAAEQQRARPRAHKRGRTMGGKSSKASKVAEEAGSPGKHSGSVIDKLTEAQLDEFREAFNSFDKVRACGARRRCGRRTPGCSSSFTAFAAARRGGAILSTRRGGNNKNRPCRAAAAAAAAAAASPPAPTTLFSLAALSSLYSLSLRTAAAASTQRS